MRQILSLLGTKPSHQRDLVMAMVTSRIICPAIKLATTRMWHNSTTFLPQLKRVRQDSDLAWVTALRSSSIA